MWQASDQGEGVSELSGIVGSVFLLSLAERLQRKKTNTPRDPQVLDEAIRAVSYMRLLCVLTASHLPSRKKSVQQPQSEADTGRQRAAA